MNIVSYPQSNSRIVYCVVDRISTYQSFWIQELMKNIGDYTISNIWTKQYSTLIGFDEDALLKQALSQGYQYAVVVSTGTEFVNGNAFFNAIEELVKKDFLIAGHVLDRKEAYYELHHQCYVVNLKLWESLQCPDIGQQNLGENHSQIEPIRSSDNYHDDYTPLWVSLGNSSKQYSHKLHGWNIISTAILHNSVIVFDDSIRNNKRHYYPENLREFQKHISWAYSREKVCADEFIHPSNTETVILDDSDFECVITPSSGIWWVDYISETKPVTVVYYDYNSSALEYWQQNAPKINNVTYKFLKINLLAECDYSMFATYSDKKTIINLSNIFCYEGTSMFTSLTYRQYKENKILSCLPKDYYTLFTRRASCGFNSDISYYGKNLQPIDIKKLNKPTWHMNQDWNG